MITELGCCSHHGLWDVNSDSSKLPIGAVTLSLVGVLLLVVACTVTCKVMRVFYCCILTSSQCICIIKRVFMYRELGVCGIYV